MQEVHSKQNILIKCPLDLSESQTQTLLTARRLYLSILFIHEDLLGENELRQNMSDFSCSELQEVMRGLYRNYKFKMCFIPGQ